MKTFTLNILATLCLLIAPAAAGSAAPGLAEQVLAEVNLARTVPRVYADLLREFRRQFRGKTYRLPGTHTLVRTAEGVKGVDEAIRFLSRQKPLPPLARSGRLAAAAAELVADEGKSGAVGHGVRRSAPQTRIERHGEWQGQIGENISYGPDEARRVVMELIVDDGVPDRGHRRNIFSRGFGTAGVACGSHPRYGTMCVIDFAGEFR